MKACYGYYLLHLLNIDQVTDSTSIDSVWSDFWLIEFDYCTALTENKLIQKAETDAQYSKDCASTVCQSLHTTEQRARFNHFFFTGTCSEIFQSSQ